MEEHDQTISQKYYTELDLEILTIAHNIFRYLLDMKGSSYFCSIA